MKVSFGWIGIGTGIIIAGAAVGAVKLRNERPIAIVNGEKISRVQFLARLERENGAPILREMLHEKLVLQEAKKKNLFPTPAQVQVRVDQMREAEPDLDRQLRLRGKTQEDLVSDLQGRLALTNLITADVKLPEAEVKKLWAEHQKEFNRPEGRKVEMVLAKSAEIGEKARRSMADGIPSEFAAQNDGMALPGGRSQVILYRGQLPRAVEQRIFDMKPGAVSSVEQMGKSFAVIKVVEVLPARQKRFEEVEQDLTLGAKLRKGKSEAEILQALQKSAKIEITSDRYKGVADTALSVRPTRVARAR